MNALDFFISLYSLQGNYKYIPSWFLTPFRRLTRKLASIILPRVLKGKRGKCKANTDIIVSLTSFPARIEEVWQVIECMLRQSYKPAKIYLWLSKEQFPSTDFIPTSLKRLENDVFNIRLVDEDIRSHKKYYYVSKENPNAQIILVDDDIYYPTTMIEDLISAEHKYPNCIICRYGSLIQYSESSKRLPYNHWASINNFTIHDSLFFGTGGGTLIKPNLLFKDFLVKDLFLKMTPLADDIWVNAMVRLANVPIVMLKPSLILPIQGKGSNVTLCSENLSAGKNDLQLDRVSLYYMDKLGVDPFSFDYQANPLHKESN